MQAANESVKHQTNVRAKQEQRQSVIEHRLENQGVLRKERHPGTGQQVRWPVLHAIWMVFVAARVWHIFIWLHGIEE
jgi:hypothetical protein